MIMRRAAQLLMMAAPLLGTGCGGDSDGSSPSPGQPPQDAWSSKVTWRTDAGWYAAPIHATLMPDGRILFIGSARDTEDPTLPNQSEGFIFMMTPTPAGQPVPAETTVSPMSLPYDDPGTFTPPWYTVDDLTCAGHTLTGDGKFFSAGGTAARFDPATGATEIDGLTYAMTSDGTSWTRVPADMLGLGSLGQPRRWYTTCTRLAGGRILVTGGDEQVLPVLNLNLSTEVYDPSTGAWQVTSAHAASPSEIWNSDYSHVFQLPSPVGGRDILMFGSVGVPVLHSASGPSPWLVQTQPRPGTLQNQEPNHGASTSLLPIRAADGEWGYANGTVLIAGGQHNTTHQSSVDVYDPVSNQWRPRLDMQTPRHHPSTVLLPDGKVLIVAGHNDAGIPGVGRTQVVDPSNGFALSSGTATMAEVRGYHTVTLLLPDGRVFVGGGNPDGNYGKEKSNFRYYEPAYMARPRPVITGVPATFGYGETIRVTGTGTDLSEAVLIGLGSMTHSIDMNQRYVQLGPVGNGPGYLDVSTPLDGRTAPPGHYMLFLLDENRVPSVARIVRLM